MIVQNLSSQSIKKLEHNSWDFNGFTMVSDSLLINIDKDDFSAKPFEFKAAI